MAYAQLKALPQDRQEFAIAQVCSVLANVHRAKDCEPFKPGDFMLNELPEEEDADEKASPLDAPPIDVRAQSAAIAAMFGKKDLN
jgi:hypothetical protein